MASKPKYTDDLKSTPPRVSRLSGVASVADAAFIAGVALAMAVWLGSDSKSIWKTIGGCCLLIEIIFFIYSKFRHANINDSIAESPDAERIKVAMDRFKQLQGLFELEDFLSGWFLGAPADCILRGNLEEFVAYGFYVKNFEDLSKQEKQSADLFLADAEEHWGYKFAAGYNPAVQFMAHTKEPLRVHHKLLAMYGVFEVLAMLARGFLRLMGFSRQRSGKFVFWKANNKASRNNKSVEKKNDMDNDTDKDTNTALDAGKATAAAAAGGKQEISHRGRQRVTVEPLGGGPSTTPSTKSPRHHHHHQGGVLEAAHSAAEHALDAAVFGTSAAAASVSKQYPHEGQQYRLPSRPQSPMARASSSSAPPQRPSFEHAALSPEEQGVPVPIVFVHGVGVGVLPYLHFIRGLMKACPDSPFIVLEIPHVALRMCREAASLDEVAAAAIASMRSLGARRACFVGHSYGTFVVSKIVQRYPEAIHSVALLDPVCLLTCYPQLLYNFIYRTIPFSALASPLVIADAVRFFCSRDMNISQSFCRKFSGMEIMLWPEDLPAREHGALVVLSGQDDLVPSGLVMAQFEASGHPARVMYRENLGHGGLLLDARWMAQVVEAVTLCVRGSEPQ